MAGLTRLSLLLKAMKPKLQKGEWVFCCVPEKKFSRIKIKPLLTFKEKEGVTLIIEKKMAKANSLHYSESWSLITLQVHSSLTAVGFLALITNRLAKEGISINVISAHYHDHLFVPSGKAKKAIGILKRLSRT